jgi:toxin ParE1/3/4
MKVRYTPTARADIDDIYRVIAPHNTTAAQQVEDKIRETAEKLLHFPGVGVLTDVEDVRRLPLVRYPYTIFYRIAVAADAIEILRVVHAATIKELGQLPE